ncbi:uncharacterized protein LOC143462885 [Clavelina lepadiformis]|uniref:Protein FAM184A/B N-terminal domain-containing protein n=1 Tax=Clavelina lepadiformis TaxID=159417 RepID=A0ABP0GYK0_CLALP
MMASSRKTPDVQKTLGFMKDSFGYKMSKKVAELTQVVHMLFSRNHEREVELDALRAAYEEEVLRITKEAKNNFERLEYLLRDATRQRHKEVVQAADNTTQLLKQTQEKMELLKQDLSDERAQSTHFRELLSKAQEDLERSKQGTDGVSETLQQTNARLKEREAEVATLKKMHKFTEEKFLVTAKDLEDLKQRFGETEGKLAQSKYNFSKIGKALEESNQRAEELSKKLQLAEEQMKFANRELKKKSKDPKFKFPRAGLLPSRQTSLKDEEIDALKREVERLRMELSNREGNFNRVFAKFQPVVVSSDSNYQKPQNPKMMMVTSSTSDTDAKRKYLPNAILNSVPQNADPHYLPKTAPGSASSVNYVSFNSNSTFQHQKTYAGLSNNHKPSSSSSSRNAASPSFRLVFTK